MLKNPPEHKVLERTLGWQECRNVFYHSEINFERASSGLAITTPKRMSYEVSRPRPMR